jgi:hypothetical protein
MQNTLLPRVVLLLALFIAGCTTDLPHSLPINATLVPPQEVPQFIDDLKLEGLSSSVQNQLAILRRETNPDGLLIGGVHYDTKHLLISLEKFNQLLSKAHICLNSSEDSNLCYSELRESINNQFLVYRLDSALLTGYYTPTIEVSTHRTDFEHKLDGKGYDIYYAANLFDIYIIQIEGGAKIIVHDKGQSYAKYLHYSDDNGHKFSQLDDYMVDHGMLKPNQRSRWAQRTYINSHSYQARAIFSSCPGYVFFKVSEKPAVTSTGIPLTADRSLASDPAYYPVKGAITFVVAKLPQPPVNITSPESNPAELEYLTMHRFFIDQDIGHFITGPARADLFFGEGFYAEFLSNNFMTHGQIYLLVSK